MFRALLVDRSDDGFSAGLTELDDAALPEGDVLVDVAHSTVNYKDGLAVTNASPIVRSWPMVPGIDLAGTVAVHTLKPVIGIPMDGGPLKGYDALLSTVQMPGGIPVACVAIGKAGARNAAYLAAQMLALSDPDLATRLAHERAANAKQVAEKDRALRARLGQ